MNLQNCTVEYIYLDNIKTGIRVKNLDTTNNCYLIPLDNNNSDYQAIQKWIAEGGVVIDNGGNE